MFITPPQHISESITASEKSALTSAPLPRCKMGVPTANLHLDAKWGLWEILQTEVVEPPHSEAQQGKLEFRSPVRRHCRTKSSLPWEKRDGSRGSYVPEGCGRALQKNADTRLSPLTIRLRIGMGSNVDPESSLLCSSSVMNGWRPMNILLTNKPTHLVSANEGALTARTA